MNFFNILHKQYIRKDENAPSRTVGFEKNCVNSMFFRKNNVYSAANKKEVNPMKKEMKNDKNNSERKMPKMQDADFCGQNLGIDAGNATASANETTGMMPTAPQNSAELEAAEELSPLQYTTLVKQKKRNKQ